MKQKGNIVFEVKGNTRRRSTVSRAGEIQQNEPVLWLRRHPSTIYLHYPRQRGWNALSTWNEGLGDTNWTPKTYDQIAPFPRELDWTCSPFPSPGWDLCAGIIGPGSESKHLGETAGGRSQKGRRKKRERQRLQLTTWTHNKILFHDRLVNHNSKNTNKTDSKSNNNKISEMQGFVICTKEVKLPISTSQKKK